MVNLEKLVLVGLLSATVAAWSQSSVPRTSKPDSNPTTKSLLARSEMQRPQPLPIVKPLRLQEIPTAEREKVRPGSITAYVSKDVANEAIDIKPVEDEQIVTGESSARDSERDEAVYATPR